MAVPARRHLVLLLSVAVAVAGCASTAPPKAGEGVAFFSVSHDREAGVGARLIVFRDATLGFPVGAASLPMSADFLKEASGAIYIAMFGRIGDLDEGYGQLHVFTLPAGTYRFDRWAITHGLTTTSPTGQPQPLEFTVTAGRVVYLGNLHAKIQLGRDFFNQQVVEHGLPEVRNLAERDLQLLRKKHPELDGPLDISPLPQGNWGNPAAVQVRTNRPVYTPLPGK
jgi:hypothetical protein